MYIVDGFKSSMGKFLDERMQWESLTALQANADGVVMPNGFKVFCNTENAWYRLSCTDCYDLSTYVWTLAEAPEGSLQTKMQFTTMPTASSEYVGKAFEYIGETDATFTHGYFYEVAEDLDNPGSYMWTNVAVQEKQVQVQYSVMPDVTELPMGSIIQFVGTATGTFIPGYFYTNEEVNYSITFADGVTPFATIASIYKLEKAGLNTTDSVVIYVDADNNWKIEDSPIDLDEIGIKLNNAYEPVDGDSFTITYVTPGVVTWINQPVQPSSGSEEAVFTSALTPTVNVQGTGIKPSTTWSTGTSIEAFIRDAFCPPAPPVFTVYSTSAPSGDIDAPFGSEIGPVEYFVNFTSLGDVVADSINVTVKQGMTTIGTTDVTGLGTFSVKDPNTVNITNTYMVHVSWLNKPGDTERIINTTNFAFKFSHYSYYGIVDVAPDALDETKIKELPTVLKLDADYTYKSIVMTNQRVCYATPTQYGDVKVIKDSNGFDITSAFTFSTMTINDQPYTVITLTNTGTYPTANPGTIIFSK